MAALSSPTADSLILDSSVVPARTVIPEDATDTDTDSDLEEFYDADQEVQIDEDPEVSITSNQAVLIDSDSEVPLDMDQEVHHDADNGILSAGDTEVPSVPPPPLVSSVAPFQAAKKRVRTNRAVFNVSASAFSTPSSRFSYNRFSPLRNSEPSVVEPSLEVTVNEEDYNDGNATEVGSPLPTRDKVLVSEYKCINIRKGKLERMRDAHWRLNQMEHGAAFLCEEPDPEFLDSQVTDTSESKSEADLTDHPGISLQPRTKILTNILYERITHKVFDIERHTNPVPVPHTLRDLLGFQGRNRILWTEAVNGELTGLFDSGTLETVTRNQCINAPIPTKFVFDCQEKENERGELAIRLKARLVALGFLEKLSTIYNSYSPTLSHGILKMVTVIALTLGFLGVDLDVQQAFLLPPVPVMNSFISKCQKESSAGRVSTAFDIPYMV